MEADFGGWVTKNGLKCTDGRTIMPGAFEHMDQKQVPLVYQHQHDDIENVLGHVMLEDREEGVYGYGFFNSTPKGQVARTQVEHKDLRSLSIYANGLLEQAKRVTHGVIREVSLVLAGANPGAFIDYVRLAHADGFSGDVDDEAAIIHMDIPIDLGEIVDDEDEEDDEDLQHADNTEDMTVQDVIDGFSEEEMNVVQYLIGVALESATADAAAQHSSKPDAGDLKHQEGADKMPRNVFDQSDDNKEDKHVLTHDAMQGIIKSAEKMGSMKDAVEAYALQHGITNIDVLFPDAKAATGVIELDKRRTEWVSAVMNGTRHTPFSRIKTFSADLTQDEARAKGYIKGTYKEEEWFGVQKRTTGPTTIYKKQELDRDDVLDITDFDIVLFLKGEMRLMTEEEIARAILIGDGRAVNDPDKVKDPLGASDGVGIRSIINDHEFFVTTLLVNVDDANSDYEEVVDAVMDGFEYYKGSGTPTFFTTIPQLNKFLKARDANDRRYYANKQEVADALGVGQIITVEPMKQVADLIGIIVNLDDYNVGTDRGGEINTFEDFDIDYNKQKYLMETRMSGALVRPKSAVVIRKTAAGNTVVAPNKPTFDKTTGVITIPTQTGVVYKDAAGSTLTAGAQTAIAAGTSKVVNAVAATNYFFADNQNDSWTFTRNPA
jgi:hypothetical protein